jgi:hypothetical protein
MHRIRSVAFPPEAVANCQELRWIIRDTAEQLLELPLTGVPSLADPLTDGIVETHAYRGKSLGEFYICL